MRSEGTRFSKAVIDAVKAGDWDAWRLQMMALPGEVFVFPSASVEAAMPVTATSAVPKGRKKDKRGGNRFIPVVETAEAGEEVSDADPA